MDTLFEISPITQIKISNATIDLKGLIVLVGSNSSGKTSLLRDIYAVASGDYRKLVVIDEVQFRPAPPLNEFLSIFEKTGDIEPITQIGRPPEYRKKGHHYAKTGGLGSYVNQNDLRVFYNRFVRHVESVHRGEVPICEFLNHLGVLECSALFIEERLALTQGLSTIDIDPVQRATALLQLASNIDAQNELTNEIRKVFKHGIWVDASGSLRISDTDSVPLVKERTSLKEMMNSRTIETEGEGLRSYVAVCITLLLAQRPLTLIDEPEMCLHPPQAKALGRFIGKHGSTPRGCTIVATHSSAIMRGVLEANPTACVIRLSRSNSVFLGRPVSADTLRGATTRPFSRSEAILDGLFTDAVALCESDGDRVVYESVIPTLPTPQPDVRFVPVGGIGGFKEPVRLYRALGVPVVVAADFDFLFKPELLKVLEEFGVHSPSVISLSNRLTEFAKQLRSSQPELYPDAAIQELKPLLDDAKNWETLQNEALLRSKLNKIIARLNRLAMVKAEGLSAVPANLKQEAKLLLAEVKKYGIFLVPRGELESWVPDLTRLSQPEQEW